MVVQTYQVWKEVDEDGAVVNTVLDGVALKIQNLQIFERGEPHYLRKCVYLVAC